MIYTRLFSYHSWLTTHPVKNISVKIGIKEKDILPTSIQSQLYNDKNLDTGWTITELLKYYLVPGRKTIIQMRKY